MILVDTSIWIDHFRQPLAGLAGLLERDLVLQHPFVSGELLLGNPFDRAGLVSFLESLDQAPICDPSTFAEYVAARALGGTRIGFVDAHLLATASLLTCTVWTRDRRLAEQAERLGLLYPG